MSQPEEDAGTVLSGPAVDDAKSPEIQRVDDEPNTHGPNVSNRPAPTDPNTIPFQFDRSPAVDTHELEETAFEFQEVQSFQQVATIERPATTETLEVELGTVSMKRAQVSQLQNGAVVALNETVEEEVLIRHGQEVVAKGKMTVVEGRIAVRISETFAHDAVFADSFSE
ncbi:MAG: FliM/FliN family flagellar motor switch protein [Planctomycetales bacterium]|nr:FliM/FliN family flagellar motor switch protein [Planctomycetales bacterium]